MATIDSILTGNTSNARNMRQTNRGDHRAERNRHESLDYAEPVSREGFTILAIMFMETGTYNPEFLRPYNVSVSRDDVNAIADIVEESGGIKIAPNQIAGTSGRILRYSSEINKDDLVDIENGWDTRRLSFLMEVIEEGRSEFDIGNNNETVTYISGFTDRMDLVGSGDSIDLPEDLCFYVSNVHRIERATRRIQTNHQMIVPTYHRGNYGSPKTLYTSRPRDVFNDEMSRELSPDSGRRLNSANRLNGVIPKTSRSSNLTASTYIASSVNALIRGETQRGSGDDGFGSYSSGRLGADTVYSKAASLLDERQAFERNSFMYLLRGKSSEFASRTTFSWGDMTEIFGRDIKRVASIYKRKRVERQQSSRWAEAGQSSEWDNTENGGYNAVFATALKQALPSYALESMIYSCRIEATNIISSHELHDAYAGILVTVSDVVFIARMPSAREESILIEQLKEAVAVNILRDVSLDNTLDFDVVVDLDWRNDSFFSVAIDGGQMIEFSSASFSNALTSPIITPDQYLTENMAADLKTIVSEILGRN